MKTEHNIRDDLRVQQHPILGEQPQESTVTIYFNGKPVTAIAGEPIASALTAAGVRVFRHTARGHRPRGIFCALGRCTDCAMTVDGVPRVRTCVTRVRDGMQVETQNGLGKWGGSHD